MKGVTTVAISLENIENMAAFSNNNNDEEEESQDLESLDKSEDDGEIRGCVRYLFY